MEEQTCVKGNLSYISIDILLIEVAMATKSFSDTLKYVKLIENFGYDNKNPRDVHCHHQHHLNHNRNSTSHLRGVI